MTLSNLQKRMLLFLGGCIVTRLLFVYLAYKLPLFALKIMGIIALFISIGFFVIFWFGLRKSGPETMGDKIWWNSLRPVHSLLYLIFAILAIMRIQKYAWIALLIDVMIGLLFFILHHSNIF
jgi:hypothetical protein